MKRSPARAGKSAGFGLVLLTALQINLVCGGPV
jgi:hypothetical protein